MNQLDKKVLSRFARLLRKKGRSQPQAENGPVVEMIDPTVKLPLTGDQDVGGGDESADARVNGVSAHPVDSGDGVEVGNEPAPESANKEKSAGTMLRAVAIQQTEIAKFDMDPPDDPGFNIFANARLWRNNEANPNYSGEVAKLYRDVFTPTRPKRSYKDFCGRRNIVESVIQAVEEERAHVVLFGEKGLGKTSLANIIVDCAEQAGYLVARVSASQDMTFSHLVLSILEQFSDRISLAPVGDLLQKRLGSEDLTELVDPENLDVPATIKIFQKLADNQALVLIDDFERIDDSDLKTKLAELMEVLSDQGAWLSMLVFGSAAQPSELMPETLQSSPNVAWIKLQPLDDLEAEQIIRRGAVTIGIHLKDEVVEAAIRLSQGIPGALQWLCLLAVRRATQRYATEVELEDLAGVVNAASNKIDPKLSASYDKLCGPSRNGWADDIMFLAVQTPVHSNGIFSTEAMSSIALETIGRPLFELPLHSALSRLTEDDGNPVLEKVWTPTGTAYRFANPTMRAIVMLKNAGRLDNLSGDLLGEADKIDYLPSPGAA